MKFNLLKNKEIKNAGWIIGEQILQMVISLVVGVLTARYLGPNNFGSLNYTASFVAFFSSIATLGMEGVLIKKIIEHPEREGQYLGSCIFYRLLSSLFSIICISVIVYLLNPNDTTKLFLVLLQSVQLVFRATHILDSWFQRHLKSKYVAIGKMIAYIVVASYKVFLLATAKNIYWFAFSNSLNDIVVALLLYVFYKHEKAQKFHVNFNLGRDVLKDSYHFIISGLMVAIYGQMDKIMIGQMMTDIDVGFYTTATAICGMWLFVPIAIINSFRPTIMEFKQSGNEKMYQYRLKQLYSLIIWFCIIVSLGIALLSKYIILFLYGEEYLGAVGALRIVVWCETFSMIGTARGIWVLCENKNKYVKYYLAIGAIVNLVLNYILIPLYGIEGASIATLCTQIVTSLIAPLFFKETRVFTRIALQSFLFSWYFKKGNGYGIKENFEEKQNNNKSI